MGMRRLIASALCLALVGLAGCDGAGGNGPGNQPSGETKDPPKIELTTPKDGATDVPASVEIAYTATGASSVEVKLADTDGAAVDGALRADGSSWLPSTQLDYGSKYTVTATAVKSDGTRAEAKATFTTMQRPTNLVDIHSWIGDDQVVGVAMPIVLTFGLDVPPDFRDDVQRRLFVRSDPPQEGIWHWFHGSEVHYRPKEHWQPGTKLDIRIATGGLPWGVNTWYGRHDLTVLASIGEELIVDVNNATKKMTVKRDGKVIRTALVSLGKPSTPSSSGTMVVISRDPKYRFDTRREIPNGYVVDVKYAMRLTWGGEFVHEAPWSNGARGRRNISHGCVNLGTADSKWLFDNIKVGDPVTIRGTEVHVAWGNGWTDWDRPWTEYVKGSALPYQPGG
jgi:lipoprotein-anchoring transpeptidase ErfK/SrfK